MSAANVVRRDRTSPLRPEEVERVLALVDAAAAHDGAAALSEAFRLGVEGRQVDGVTHLLAFDANLDANLGIGSGEPLGYAQVRAGAPGEPPAAELVVAPGRRRAGIGSALLRALPPGARVWSHAAGPAGAAAEAFAAARGLLPVRSLHVMGRSLRGGPPWPPAALPERYAVRTFEPGRDEDAWLELNARAFAHHPEQGSLTRADLDQRMRQPWWDPAGLILVVAADDPDRLVASHWTKVDPPGGDVGEVYVVAVSPDHQGEGLGRAVTVLGLDHLRSRGLARVVLYVDEENIAAVRTYRRLGFDDLEVHRQYARPTAEPGADPRTPLTADEVRRAFIDFMAERGHATIDRASLVPRDDPTTLFTGSGMQALLPYLLGADHPAGRRLVDSQPCLRVQDIEEIGDNRHTTFFEMLGSWSLGDYFKEVQLPQLWTFLTERVGLDPQRIYVSCFSGDPANGIPKDDESAAIWTSLFAGAGIAAERVDVGTEERAAELGTGDARIVFYGAKNWWCRGGWAESMPVGEPGGPDSEVFYLFPQVPHDPAYGAHCHPNCDCGRFIELGNSVFMEYRRTETGFEPLPRRNVDYGGGLSRIAAAALDTPDVFRIGLLWPVIERLQHLSGRRYEDEERAMRVIADHLCGATFLAVDGVRPGNKSQGYVLRRLTRRAVRFALELGVEDNFFPHVVPTVARIYEDHYPEVREVSGQVVALLAREEQAFRRTLATGLRHLEEYRDTGITGTGVFTLYDTYGFPVELSTEEARTRGIALSPMWREEFEARMAEQRARSQRAPRRHG